jgi:NhaP-type Na+/H+ or K+/H+ antiporter
MSLDAWCVIVGLLLVSMLLIDSFLAKLPTSAAMIYLAVGFVLGPGGFAFITPDPIQFSKLLGMAAEAAVLISLFAMGLKLTVPIFDQRWLVAIRLAFPSMLATIGAIAIAAHFGFGFSLGAAILLGGILAPTDPVLASSVQVGRTSSDDGIRFGLAGEGALNDGAAFPFVLLGLGLLNVHPLGAALWHWWAIDLIWSIAGGLLVGGAIGMLIGRLVVYLRTRFHKAIGLNEFLTLGLIAISYGVAQLMLASGFLAVLAAGLALRRVKENPIKGTVALKTDTVYSSGARVTHSHHASASMKEAVEDFNLQLEKLAELTVVLLVGAMLPYTKMNPAIAAFIVLLFLIIRPIATWLGLLGVSMPRHSKALIGWLGIRGIGSIFYLMLALGHGLSAELAQKLISLTLLTVAASIIVHGLTVRSLMRWHDRRLN